MAFISYAQNFEDVTLWRALEHVPAGRYIDVGAQDPAIDSVSKAFYERGWRGLHVVPLPCHAEALRGDRPDETVVQLALPHQDGASPEPQLLDNIGLTRDAGLGSKLPLRTAFAALKGLPVHWMKIDAEGLQEAIVRGWDSEALRPWIVLIKATEPTSAEACNQDAERILLAARYEFACFNGVYRFYLAAEHAELMPALSSSPQVPHSTETHRLHATLSSLRTEAARTQGKEQQLRHEIQTRIRQEAKMRAALRLAEAQRKHAEHRLDAMLRSSSWRVTAPLRSVGTIFRRLRDAVQEGRLKSGIKSRIKVILRRSAVIAVRHPVLKRGIQAGLRLLPPLDRRLRTVLGAPTTVTEASLNDLPPARPLSVNDLTPNAARIYAALNEVHTQSK